MLPYGPNQRALILQSALALLSLAFVAAVACLLARHYTTNDDVTIIAFTTEGHIVPYEGALLTGFLHLLYSSAPDIAWYGWMLYALQWLCLYLWLMLVWRVCRRPWIAVTGSLIVLACDLQFIASLNFTGTAAMLCMVAIAWVAMQALEARGGVLPVLAPGCVFALGMLVRPDSLWGAIAYLTPFAVATAIVLSGGRPSWSAARRLVAISALFVLPAVIAGSLDVVYRHAQMTPVEAQYEAFNSAAGGFEHLSAPRKHAASDDPAVLQAAGWSRHDFTMLDGWQFLDERIYTPQAARVLLDAARLSVPTPDELEQTFLERLPPGTDASLILFAAWPLALLLFLSGQRSVGLIFLLTPVYCIALTVWMYLQYAYHPRIELPFVTGAGFATLVLAMFVVERDGLAQGNQGKMALLAIAFALGLAAGAGGSSAILHRHANAGAARATAAQLDWLNTEFPGAAIIVEPPMFRIQWLDPLKPLQLKFQPINFGWNMFSPRFYAQISALKIDHGYELMDAMVDRPGAYLLATQDWCMNLLSYVHTDAAGSVTCQPVAKDIYRLTKAR